VDKMKKQMPKWLFLLTVLFLHTTSSQVRGASLPDSLPLVLPANHGDLVHSKLRHEANLKFAEHALPENIEDWNILKEQLRAEVIAKTGLSVDHDLPLDIRETASSKMSGYSIKNIYFQTRPDIYATANLYVPEGAGPFPGVILMCGHSRNGKLYDFYQSVGHSLALNGYVALAIDPWGAGERGTDGGEYEYHGANLGASLMNIGESLLGMQICDNMRGVDLLCSLPQVDKNKIGATGASGGGNQTMWLSAMDERVKAAVPVVSVGSFESYIMRSNCICETLVDGLTFTEEAAILALSNAIMPCNHERESNAAFFPDEMLRTFENAKKIFELDQRGDDISYQIFDQVHGYHPEDRRAMLGWFDQKLKGKGTGKAKDEVPFDLVPEEDLMVFPDGDRDPLVINTAEFCKNRGSDLRTELLGNTSIDVLKKRQELSEVLGLGEKEILNKVHKYSSAGTWEKIAIETSEDKLIPVLLSRPKSGISEYVVFAHSLGKNEIPKELLSKAQMEGKGIVVVDLTGIGESASPKAIAMDSPGAFHTLARAQIWLGKTTIGEWVKELSIVEGYLRTAYNATSVSIDGDKEVGLAGLFLASFEGNIDGVTLRNAPISYLFDNRESIDYFSMAVHLPGFLKWGDVSLAAALSGVDVQFIDPVTMSGSAMSESKLREFHREYDQLRKACGQSGQTNFE